MAHLYNQINVIIIIVTALWGAAKCDIIAEYTAGLILGWSY